MKMMTMKHSVVSSPGGLGATAPDPVEELAAYFATTELPPDGYMLDAVTRLDDVRLFVSSHLAMLRGRAELKGYRPYLTRLLIFKQQLEMKKKKVESPKAEPKGHDVSKHEGDSAMLAEALDKAGKWHKGQPSIYKFTSKGDTVEG